MLKSMLANNEHIKEIDFDRHYLLNKRSLPTKVSIGVIDISKLCQQVPLVVIGGESAKA